LFGERGGEKVLVGDVGSDILFGTEFSCLGLGNESFFELRSEDAFRRSEVIVVDIGHEGYEFGERCIGVRRRGNRELACVALPYMRFCGGVLIFKLPYRFRGVDVSCVYPFIIGVRVPLPFDKVLRLPSSAELPRVQNLLDLIFFVVIDEVWSQSRIVRSVELGFSVWHEKVNVKYVMNAPLRGKF